LAHPVRFSFRTASDDISPPRMLSSEPPDGTEDYPPNLALRLEFNESIAEPDDSLTAAVLPQTDLNLEAGGRSLFISASGGWAINTSYTLTISGVADASGNRSAGSIVLNFATGDQSAPHRDIQPEWNRVADVIVFASDRLGRYDIYRILPDGTGLVRMTSEPGDELHPTVSSDGLLLAYQRRGPQGDWDIFVQSFQGIGEPVAISASPFNDTEPTFTRTFSRNIIYVSDRSIPRGIFRMNSDGSNPTELDRTFGSTQTDVAPHPLVENQMLFATSRGGSRDIWSKTISVVDGEAVNQNLTGDLFSAEHSPAWGPDASFFVFIADASGEDNLWMADPTGGFPRQITNFTRAAGGPAVSPFTGDARCVISLASENGGSDLVLVDMIGGAIVSYLTGKEGEN
ncbi:PD40 domain-containing protein, partial [bacterium]|nr:PD40 domain-containing protein [bacterium]